jgi:hypothetical protein
VCTLISTATLLMKGEETVRERERELRRRRKRKEENQRAKRKSARVEAAAKKGK